MPSAKRPYLIRAFYDWICDNHWTPYIRVDTSHPKLSVPTSVISGKYLVLNIGPRAAKKLIISNARLSFEATFSGMLYALEVPVASVLSIYAKENQEGISFEFEEFLETEEDSNEEKKTSAPFSKNKKVSHLKIIRPSEEP